MGDSKKTIEQILILAVKYLSYRPRTLCEIKIYLKKKKIDTDIITQVITILIKDNYLNDKKFTKLYIDSMVKNKPKSKFALSFELKKKGVEQSIIDSALEPYDDNEMALKAVATKTRIWKNLDSQKFKKKLMNFLQYRGFNYAVSMRTLNIIEKKM